MTCSTGDVEVAGGLVPHHAYSLAPCCNLLVGGLLFLYLESLASPSFAGIRRDLSIPFWRIPTAPIIPFLESLGTRVVPIIPFWNPWGLYYSFFSSFEIPRDVVVPF